MKERVNNIGQLVESCRNPHARVSVLNDAVSAVGFNAELAQVIHAKLQKQQDAPMPDAVRPNERIARIVAATDLQSFELQHLATELGIKVEEVARDYGIKLEQRQHKAR